MNKNSLYFYSIRRYCSIKKEALFIGVATLSEMNLRLRPLTALPSIMLTTPPILTVFNGGSSEAGFSVALMFSNFIVTTTLKKTNSVILLRHAMR